MTVDEVKLFVDYISNKEQSGNALSPDEFNRLLKASSLDFSRYIYGAAEVYQNTKSAPTVGYETIQYVTDAVSVLKVKTDISLIFGAATLPTDYAHVSSIRYNYVKKSKCEGDSDTTKEVPVEVVKDDKLGERLSSDVNSPTERYPICVFYNGSIQVYPKTCRKVIFTYLKVPATPFRAYTMTGDIDVYDPSGSTQIEFPEIYHIEICRIILSYMGINLRDNELQAFNERYKQQGK